MSRMSTPAEDQQFIRRCETYAVARIQASIQFGCALGWSGGATWTAFGLALGLGAVSSWLWHRQRQREISHVQRRHPDFNPVSARVSVLCYDALGGMDDWFQSRGPSSRHYRDAMGIAGGVAAITALGLDLDLGYRREHWVSVVFSLGWSLLYVAGSIWARHRVHVFAAELQEQCVSEAEEPS